MVLTRATLNENGEATNFTSPFVDQNQTYTSHPSHQIWLREYVFEDRGEGERPYATGGLIEGSVGGGMATWGDVKAQALELGFVLTDFEAINLLSAEKRTVYTYFVCPSNILKHTPVEYHSRIVLSPDAEANPRLSGAHST